MIDPTGAGTLVLVIGAAIALAVLARTLLSHFGLPSLLGYLGLGIALRLADSRLLPLLDARTMFSLELLAELGVIALLFRVGLENRPAALLGKLPQAVPIWFGNLLVAGGLGYAAARWLLGWSLAESLVIALALTATSVGVAVASWEQIGRMDSEGGQLLLDVAELDDVSGIALMGALISVLPALMAGTPVGGAAVALQLAGFALSFGLFLAGCYLFSQFVEPHISRYTARLDEPPARMLVVVGVGMIIAALAAQLGFSLALGALFAGLVFSRDPQAVKTEASFENLHAFFTPFFFIGIGLQVEPVAALDGLAAGGMLLLFAVLGKLLGTWLPAAPLIGRRQAWTLALAMVPRAEIAMVIVFASAPVLGAEAAARLYTAMAVVVTGTCALAPLTLRRRSVES